MKKLFLLVFCAFCAGGYAFSESVYSWDLTTDVIVGGAALGVFLPPLFLEGKAGEVIQKGDINYLDRQMMFSYNKGVDDASTWGAYVALVMPAVSVLGNLRGRTLATYAVMYAEAFLLTYGTKDLLKFAVARNRPYTYFGDIPGDIPEGEEKDYYNSFPSGHTSYAFLGATFLSTTFSAEYPDSKLKLPVIIGSYALAAGIASMRVLSGSHFFTDVLAGAAIGSLYGWLVPTLHLRRNGQGSAAIIPTANGLMFAVSF
jgi:membrane-associated phospholipid phosphatase